MKGLISLLIVVVLGSACFASVAKKNTFTAGVKFNSIGQYNTVLSTRESGVTYPTLYLEVEAPINRHSSLGMAMEYSQFSSGIYQTTIGQGNIFYRTEF